MRDIFISYVEEDGAIARQVAEGLEAEGYTTWSYECDGLPGPDYLAQVGVAIDQARAVVLIISPNSLGSNQVTTEVIRAFETKKPFVPILRDITHSEFQQRQPVWRQALGAATSVRLPPEGVGPILPRMIAGLSALGLQPGGKRRAPDTAYPVREPLPSPVSPRTIHTRAWPAWGTAAVVLAALVIIVGVWWGVAHRAATETPTPAATLPAAPLAATSTLEQPSPLPAEPAETPAAPESTPAPTAEMSPVSPATAAPSTPSPAPAPSLDIHATAGTILDVGGGQLAWSPDGKWLAIGKEDIYIYDARTMEQVRVIKTGGGSNGLAFSPDGKVLAVMSRGVTLYDPATGGELRALPRTENNTSATCGSFLAFSPDSATVAVVVGDTIKLFDVASGQESGTLVARSTVSIAFASDGKSLFAGGWEGITVLDVAGGQPPRTLGDSRFDASCLALSADGAVLVSAAVSSSEVTLWEASTGRRLRSLAASAESVSSPALSPDGRLLATAGRDVAIRLWDVANGAVLQTLLGHSRQAEKLAFSPDGATLASTSWDGTTRLWTLSAGGPEPEPTVTQPGAGARPTAVPISGRAITVDNAAKTESVNVLDVEGRHVAWSPDGKWLVIGGRQIHFLDAQSLAEVRAIPADRWVEGLAFSPDAKTLAAIDETRGVMLFDAATGSELRTLPRSDVSTSAASSSFLAFSPDSAILAMIVGDTVKLFDVAGGEEVGIIVAQGANAIAFSPDGRSLYAGGTSGVSVYAVPGGELLRSFGTVFQSANRLALSADGTQLASGGSFDEPMVLWETGSGRQLRTFNGHTGGIQSLVLSPNGAILASAAGDVTVNLWDVATGSLLQTLVGHTRAAESIAFSPDGATLASTAYDEGLWLWGVP